MKKVIIVGGGIAGLTAGVYAKQSGYDVTIFEKHIIPGGNSTGWSRNGYYFEGGMHWLVGSSSKSPINKVWREIGALSDNNPVYNRDPFLTYMDKNASIRIHRDAKTLKNHLLSISPNDASAINILIKDMLCIGKLTIPTFDIKGIKAKYRSTPPISMIFALIGAMPKMNRLKKITVQEYTDKFRHEGIRNLLSCIVGPNEFSAMSMVSTLGTLAYGDAGYPKGGSIVMAQNIAKYFQELGGEIKYNARVENILVEDGKSTGIVSNGETYKADSVIVTADTLTAIDTLFDKPLRETWMNELRNEVKPLNCTFISLGVKADLNHMPASMVFPLKSPFNYGGIKYDHIAFNNYADYEGYAPYGCTALTCALLGSDTYDEWHDAKEAGEYSNKKQALAKTIIEKLNEVIPETCGKVEVCDVATPLTYERYCNTYRGSWMSIMGTDSKRQHYPCKSEIISNIYFAGQRLMIPGGLPVAAYTGRLAVQYMCRDNDTMFQADYEK